MISLKEPSPSPQQATGPLLGALASCAPHTISSQTAVTVSFALSELPKDKDPILIPAGLPGPAQQAAWVLLELIRRQNVQF